MSWYKTGTVAINNGSTTVTGVGTEWVDNVDVGEGILLLGPVPGRFRCNACVSVHERPGHRNLSRRQQHIWYLHCRRR